jgi:hypothetical protein
MHEHDLDLIAALADGSASDERLARSLVETCLVCRAEYEAQLEVNAWLAAAPTPEMTDMERAGLHRIVRAGIENEARPGTGTPWWQRLGYVAAGLLVAAGLVGVLQRTEMMGGDSGAVSDVTTAAAEGGAEAPTEGVPFVAEDAGEDMAAPTTTAAAEGTLASEEALAIPFARFAEEARASQNDRDLVTLSDEHRECLARAGLDRHVVVREFEDAGTTYLVVVSEEPEAEEVVIFVVTPDCHIVHEER